MLKLIELEAEKFMGISHVEIPFPENGVITFLGEIKDERHMTSNGAGKSTLIDALAFAILGRPVRNIRKAALLPDHGKSSKGYSRIVFETDDKRRIQIVRWINKSKAEISIDGNKIKMDSDAVGAFINLDHRTFSNIHVLTRQDSFVFETPKMRQKLFEKFVGLDLITEVMKAALKDRRKEYTTLVDTLTGKLDALKAEADELKKRLLINDDQAELADSVQGWSNIRQSAEHAFQELYEIFEVLAEIKDVTKARLNSRITRLEGFLIKTRREISWCKQDADNNAALLKAAKLGRCKVCNAKLPSDKVKAEVERLYALLKTNEKSKAAKLRRVLRLTEKQSVLKRQLEGFESKFSALRESSAVARVKLVEVRKSAEALLSQYQDRHTALNTRRDLLTTNQAEVTAAIQQADQAQRKARRYKLVSEISSSFVDNELQQLLLQGYLANFNHDLQATLRLFAGFKGHFTKDFDIVIKNNLPFNAASTGEQMRFVLATYMNLFRYCAINKNRFNFLAFDDFDLGVDDAGRNSLADTFSLLGQNLCVFVLSQSEIFNSFPMKIVAIKEKGKISYELIGF